jgi:hypothetical protein
MKTLFALSIVAHCLMLVARAADARRLANRRAHGHPDNQQRSEPGDIIALPA